ncbi:hypothetical protein AHAS_Ahas16G0174400 [Arachis hypogaea]
MAGLLKRSLNPTSNTSEVTIERTLLIYSIMKGENVNMGEMIASNIQRVLTSTKDSTRLAFQSIIQHFCDEAGVETSIDKTLLEQDKPITAKKMEKWWLSIHYKGQDSIELMCKHHKSHHNKKSHMSKHQFYKSKNNF